MVGGERDAAPTLETYLGREFRNQRRLLNLSLAKVADEAGVSTSLVSKVEHARLSPSLSTIAVLCKALGIDIRELFAKYDRLLNPSAPTCGAKSGACETP